MFPDSRACARWFLWLGKARRWGVVGLLMVGAIVIAGMRGGDAAAYAQQPQAGIQKAGNQKADDQKSSGIDLTYFDDEARMMLAFRPTELLGVPEIKAAVEEGLRDAPFFSLLMAGGIDQVTVMVGEPPVGPQFVVLQFSKSITAEELIQIELLQADAVRITADVVDASPYKQGYGILNDRTYVIGVASTLAGYLSKRNSDVPLIASDAAWEKVSKGAVVAAVDMESLRKLLPPGSAPDDAAAGPLSEIAPLWTDCEYVAAGIMIEGPAANVRVVATCSDVEFAKDVVDAALAGKTFAQNWLRAAKENGGNLPDLSKASINIAEDLLKELKIERAEKLVVAQTGAELSKVGKVAASSALEFLSQSREAARRSQSANNIKQIMLAMHIWADSNKTPGVPGLAGMRLPPPVIVGKDGKGKVPHSWRVELLPFLGHEELYRQYNFDEPWDSETNKRVLEKMPAVFRHPTDDVKSKTSAYYVMTGLELLEDMGIPSGFPTVFSAKNGIPLSQIVDGTSNTIAVVEAKVGIPWTKPEDIAFDPALGPPVLEGFFKDSYHVGFCDGAARALKYDLDRDVLRRMLTPGEGLPIPD